METVFSLYDDPSDMSVPAAARAKPRRRRDVPACAECRRLKMKCDRTDWPCGRCVKRGCAAICPTGTMAPAHSRADEETLALVGVLRERVRGLEAALEAAAGAAHPMLAPELRDIAPASSETSSSTHPTPPPPRRPRGIGDQAEPEPEPEPAQDLADLLELGQRFPMPLGQDEILDIGRAVRDVKALLPPPSSAATLITAYYDGFSAKLPSVTDEMFARRLHEAYVDPPRTDVEGVHLLALVFLAYALAKFRDGEDSEPFFQAAKTLLVIRSCITSTSGVTIHALLLLAMYCRLTSRPSEAWINFGLMGRLVYANNIHRDPLQWGVDGERAAYWRATFWEAYAIDMLYTLSVQRAPTYNIRFIDCPMPELDLETPDPVMRASNNFYMWRYRFTSEILPDVLEHILGARKNEPTTYGTILALDRVVRDSWVPPSLQLDRTNPVDEGGPPGSAIHRFIILWYRELTLLFLHRTALAIALTDVGDPLSHRFSPSVLASFRSAHKLTSSLRTLASRSDSGLASHHVCFWQAGFVATTILGCLAILLPHTPLGQAARDEALLVATVYGASTAPVPAKIRAWLILLKQKLSAPDNPDTVFMCAPEWDQFGQDETPRRGRHPPLIVRTEADPPTFDIQQVLGGTFAPSAAAAPLAAEGVLDFSHFAPLADASHIQGQGQGHGHTGDWTTGMDAVGLGLSGGLQQPMQPPPEEVTDQWERFLGSIGLSSQGL